MEEPGRVLRETGRFYALAFALSWAGWMPALLRQWGVPAFKSVLWLGLTALGAAGPAIAAWIVDRRTFASFRKRLGWRTLVTAALIPAGLLLMTNGLSWVLLGLHPRGEVRGRQLLWMMTMALGANVWEEAGWRAYALRRLEDVMKPWIAAVVVGVLWAGWHVPLFFSKWSGNGADPIRMVGGTDRGNIRDHDVDLQSHRRKCVGSHGVSCRIKRVGSVGGGLVAWDGGSRGLERGGYFAVAHWRVVRPGEGTQAAEPGK